MAITCSTSTYLERFSFIFLHTGFADFPVVLYSYLEIPLHRKDADRPWDLNLQYHLKTLHVEGDGIPYDTDPYPEKVNMAVVVPDKRSSLSDSHATKCPHRTTTTIQYQRMKWPN